MMLKPFEMDRFLVERVIGDFVDRMVQDPMIGFFFRETNVEQLKQHELAFTLRFLGMDSEYKGRTLPQAHQNHPISDGHFDRRKHLLRQVFEQHVVDVELREFWLLHVEQFREVIVRGSEACPSSTVRS